MRGALEAAPFDGWTLNMHTNCYEGRGATEMIDAYVHTSTGDVDLEDVGSIATLKCQMRCSRRAGCTSFTVNPTAGGTLNCWLRHSVSIALCDRGPDAKRFHTYVRT